MLSRRLYTLFSKLKHNSLFLCKRHASSENFLTFKDKISNGPGLTQFIIENDIALNTNLSDVDPPPYVIQNDQVSRKVYVETYGCQMNFNDTEIVLSVLQKAGFEITTDFTSADVIFLMTCAIREGAEQKIWRRLKYFRDLKNKHKFTSNDLKVGVLGCMAERLKEQMLEIEKLVDIVAGPDSYRDLPNLLSLANDGQKAVNVMLSADETYADILPVKINSESKTAFVSIMRGCNNLCSFCIVPFTRGIERSRAVSSILDEIRYLSDQGIKEITLLGQNVNSYRDVSETSLFYSETALPLSPGFSTIYKKRVGGFRFADLLYKVADVNPEIRIRFTSPHPKDFPDEVLHVINEKPNICKLIHLPAQSGNSNVLSRMGRGYTREMYLELVEHIKEITPDIAFTSDFICGFCGETDEEHQDTLSLMEKVKYEYVYMFPYSIRKKTRAYRNLVDDVPEDVKKQRASEVAQLFRNHALDRHQSEIGKYHLIQILGPSKRSEMEWSGRNDWNTKVIFPQIEIPVEEGSTASRIPSPGDYAVVQITGCSSQILKGKPLYFTSLRDFYYKNSSQKICKSS